MTRLHIGASNAVSRIISRARKLAEIDRKTKRMKDRLAKKVEL